MVQAQGTGGATIAKPSAALIRTVATPKVLTSSTKPQTPTVGASQTAVIASPVKPQATVQLTTSPSQQQLQQLQQIQKLQEQLQQQQQKQQQQQRVVTTLLSPAKPQGQPVVPHGQPISMATSATPLVIPPLPPAAVVTPGGQLTLSSAGLVPANNQSVTIQRSVDIVKELTKSQVLPNLPHGQAAEVSQVVAKREKSGRDNIQQPAPAATRSPEQMAISSLDLLAAASLQKAKAEVPLKMEGENLNEQQLPAYQHAEPAQPAPSQQLRALQLQGLQQQQHTPAQQAQIQTLPQQQLKTHPQLAPQQLPQQQQLIKQIALQQLIDLRKQQQQQQQPLPPVTTVASVAHPSAIAVPGMAKSTGLVVSNTGPAVMLAQGKMPVSSSKVVSVAETVKNIASPPPAAATTVQMAGVMANAGGRMVQLRFAVPAGMNISQLLQMPTFQQQLASLQVSSIHGITTSTVDATPTATHSTTGTVGGATLSALPPRHPPPQLSQVKASPVKSTLVAPSLQNTSSAVSLGKVRTVTTVGSVVSQSDLPLAVPNTHLLSPKKALMATAPPQTVAMPTAGVAQAQAASGKVLFLNINGQLVQAQGLTLGTRAGMAPRIVTQVPGQVMGGARLVTPAVGQVGGAKIVTPTLGSVAGTQIMTGGAVSSKIIQQATSQTPLVTSLPQQQLTSPSKLPIAALQGTLQQNLVRNRAPLLVGRQAVGQLRLPLSSLPLQVRLPTGVRLAARPASQIAAPSGGFTRVSLPPGSIMMPRAATDQKSVQASIQNTLQQLTTGAPELAGGATSTLPGPNLTNGN